MSKLFKGLKAGLEDAVAHTQGKLDLRVVDIEVLEERIHIGSNFHDLLREEGIYEECRAGAMKKIIAHELEFEIKKDVDLKFITRK